jgi:hypothetical protein
MLFSVECRVVAAMADLLSGETTNIVAAAASPIGSAI